MMASPELSGMDATIPVVDPPAEMTSALELSLIDLQLSENVGVGDIQMNVDDLASCSSIDALAVTEHYDGLLAEREIVKSQQPFSSVPSATHKWEKAAFGKMCTHMIRRNKKFLSKPYDWLLQDIMDDYILYGLTFVCA